MLNANKHVVVGFFLRYLLKVSQVDPPLRGNTGASHEANTALQKPRSVRWPTPASFLLRPLTTHPTIRLSSIHQSPPFSDLTHKSGISKLAMKANHLLTKRRVVEADFWRQTRGGESYHLLPPWSPRYSHSAGCWRRHIDLTSLLSRTKNSICTSISFIFYMTSNAHGHNWNPICWYGHLMSVVLGGKKETPVNILPKPQWSWLGLSLNNTYESPPFNSACQNTFFQIKLGTELMEECLICLCVLNHVLLCDCTTIKPCIAYCCFSRLDLLMWITVQSH